jgi:hypothetical protein
LSAAGFNSPGFFFALTSGRREGALFARRQGMIDQEEEMCDVEVVLKEPFAERESTIDGLRRNGLSVTDVDRDDGVVEGTIPAGGVAVLQKLESVAYVRIVFTYMAKR